MESFCKDKPEGEVRSKPSRHITGAALYSLEGWASLEQLLIAALNLTCCGSPPVLLSCAPFLCPAGNPMPGLTLRLLCLL